MAEEGLHVTSRCAEHIKSLGNDRVLRVLVDAGGCGGFQYRFEVEEKMEEDDLVFEKDGSQVVVDSTSMEYLKVKKKKRQKKEKEKGDLF
jgi:iron-sulfur cluster assembly accessory protein